MAAIGDFVGHFTRTYMKICPPPWSRPRERCWIVAIAAGGSSKADGF
jgi:hypothetical protein